MSTVIGIFQDHYNNKKPLPVVKPGSQTRRFTHINDTVNICYVAWKKNLCRHYSIASKNSIFQKVKNKFINNKLLYSNYINFNQLLKENNSLSKFVKELVFQQNYIDPNILWQDFMNNELKYEFILNIASIQINSKLNHK